MVTNGSIALVPGRQRYRTPALASVMYSVPSGACTSSSSTWPPATGGGGVLLDLSPRRQLQAVQERLSLLGRRVALHLRAAGTEHVQRAALVVGLEPAHTEEPRLAERRVVGRPSRDLVDDDDLALVQAADEEPPRAAVVGHRLREEVGLVQAEGDGAALRRRDERLQLLLPFGPARVVAQRLEGGRHEHVGGDALLDQQAERIEGVAWPSRLSRRPGLSHTARRDGSAGPRRAPARRRRRPPPHRHRRARRRPRRRGAARAPARPPRARAAPRPGRAQHDEGDQHGVRGPATHASIVRGDAPSGSGYERAMV